MSEVGGLRTLQPQGLQLTILIMDGDIPLGGIRQPAKAERRSRRLSESAE